MTGADLLALTLRERNVEFVATLCGNGLNPLYLACRDAGIRLIDTRNEQAAAYMADAYARLTRRVGVCAVSSGVAHVNALAGVANAWFDGAPLLLVSAESPSWQDHMGKFQELDHVALARPLCKYARRVLRPGKIAFYVREALAHATSGRPGPVHLSIPEDVLAAEVPEGQDIRVEAGPGEVRQDAAADPDLVAEAARLLAEARRPLIVAGTGVFYDEGHEELAELAELAQVPVVIPIWDRGCVERPAEWFMGVVGAASGEPPLLPDADLILLVGARIDYRTGFCLPPAVAEDVRLVRIDVDAVELRSGVEPQLKLLGDPCTVLGQLVQATRRLSPPPHREWLEEAKKRNREFRARWLEQPAAPSDTMTGRQVVEAIAPLLDDDVVFLIDGGNIGQWAHMVLADRYPRSWVTCGASAVVGWGVAGAIGARLAYPRRPVVLLCGDGAFGFGVAELETSLKHSAPFVAVVADDNAWGIVASGQLRQHGREGVLASRMGQVDYAAVAKAFGAEAITAQSPAEIAAGVESGLDREVTTVIHVPIAIGGPADL